MPITRSQRRLLLLGALAFSACTFGATRTIIDSGEIAAVHAAASNTDADLLFLGDGSGQMAQADPATGTVTGQVALWGGVNSVPIAITPDGEDSQDVWALHADGFVVNWSAGPTIDEWFWPPAGGGGAREYCDLDHTSDGDFFMTTLDAGSAILWRRDGDTSAWTSTVLGDADCPRVAHDLFHDELYVLRGNGFTLEHRDSTSLASISSVILDVDGGTLRDIDVFGTITVGASGPMNTPWGPVNNTARIFDPATGVATDTMTYATGEPTSVHISANANTSTGEMLISAATGAKTVYGILLLD